MCAMEACGSEQSVWAPRRGWGEPELTFQVNKEKQTDKTFPRPLLPRCREPSAARWDGRWPLLPSGHPARAADVRDPKAHGRFSPWPRLPRGSAAARAARTPRGGQPPLTAPGCPAGAARGADTRHSPGDPGGTEPCHGRGRAGPTPGCAPVRRCATGPRRPREMTLPRWDAHGCGDACGDTPGARPDRRGCAGREAAPTFQNCLFLPRDLLVVDIWNTTVTHRDTIRSPDLALGEHSPPPQ